MLLTGARAGPASSPPSPLQVNEPRHVQFLEEALEWPEMAYSFNAGGSQAFDGGDPGDGGDELFRSFLQADQARILLPVRPGRQMAFLYFFSSGRSGRRRTA